MNNIKEVFYSFFKVGSEYSMARLLAFLCGIAALLVSIGALWMGLKERLTYDYVTLAALLWAASFGGKNWSKNVELKSNKENGSTAES